MSSSEDPNFELRIIRIDWAGKDDVADIESAEHPVSLEHNTSGEFFSAEVPSYPKVDGLRHGQLAVSTSIDSVPQLSPPGESIPMESVSDPVAGKEWWIEKGEWQDKDDPTSPVFPGYHDAPSCRHGGTVHLQIGNQRCQIHFTPPGFREDEFAKLLSDFQDECWQLIFSDESYTTASVEDESAVPGEDFIELAQEILQAAKQILKNPHHELQEEQSLQRTSQVRPVPRTFKELASKGWPRKVTGRSHQSDYNTPENQYVASLIKRLLRAVDSFQRSGKARRDRLEEQISWLGQRVKSIEDGVTQVAPSRLENFAEREEERLQEWRTHSADLFPVGQRSSRDSKEGRIVFRVKNSPTTEYWGDLSFWVHILRGDDGVTALENHQFRFYCQFEDTDFFDKDKTYEAYLSFYISEEQNQRGEPYARWIISRIEDVDILQPERLREAKHLRRVSKEMQSEGGEAQKVDLPRAWNREEQQRERQSLRRRTKLYNQIRAQWEGRLEELTRLQRELSEVRRQFKQRGVDSSLHAHYPGTVVFVQEPAYRAIHAAYQDLQGETSFQEDLFDKLLSLDDLTILDLPAVYERWCLLQIVRVLREEYGFTPVEKDEEGISQYLSWRKDMVDAVSKGEPFKMIFRSGQLQRYVELTHQAELQSGKRPDFLLRVRGKNQHDSEGQWAPEIRVVLDAKFKDFEARQGKPGESTLGGEIKELADGKDYAEQERGRENAVFVLHPSEDAVPEPATSQRWAGSSYYGGEKVFECQKDRPNHRRGAVSVRPQKRDDIKRLIAMVLSYFGEENEGNKRTDKTKQKRFCVVCGEGDISRIQSEEPEDSESYWYKCENNNCKHLTIINHCKNCGNRLWKHGIYWTFHDTHPLSPYNIKCPQCGSYAPVSNENDEL